MYVNLITIKIKILLNYVKLDCFVKIYKFKIMNHRFKICYNKKTVSKFKKKPQFWNVVKITEIQNMIIITTS